jgi:hypothetical protein
MNKFYLSFVSIILAVGLITAVINVKEKEYTDDFSGTLSEVRDFWLETTGKKPKTPIRPLLDWRPYPNVLAFCYTQPGNKYISFNYQLINKYAKIYPNVIFQVILHEYSHCEADIGHIEMSGHFMDAGGAPWLTKNEVKGQFKDYIKYYRFFYNKYFRKEEDINNMYALIIEEDSQGNLIIKCPCKTCTGIK